MQSSVFWIPWERLTAATAILQSWVKGRYCAPSPPWWGAAPTARARAEPHDAPTLFDPSAPGEKLVLASW